MIWTEFSSSIRVLMDNKFVYQPFWDQHNGLAGAEDWQSKFERAKVAAHKALTIHSTATILSIVLSRMYTLRNQLIHGGATWNSMFFGTFLCAIFCFAVVGIAFGLFVKILNTGKKV